MVTSFGEAKGGDGAGADRRVTDRFGPRNLMLAPRMLLFTARKKPPTDILRTLTCFYRV
jgi:hypothetical protein